MIEATFLIPLTQNGNGKRLRGEVFNSGDRHGKSR